MAFFVFLAGAARAGIVAAYFRAGADWFWGFGLRCAGLILQIFLLALLFAFELAGDVGQALRWRLRCAGCGAGYSCLRATGTLSERLRLGAGGRGGSGRG